MKKYTEVDLDFASVIKNDIKPLNMVDARRRLMDMGIEIDTCGVRDCSRPWENTIYIRTQRKFPFHIALVWHKNS